MDSRNKILNTLVEIGRVYAEGIEPFLHSGELEYVLLDSNQGFDVIKEKLTDIYVSESEFQRLLVSITNEEAYWLLFAIFRHSLTHHQHKHMSVDTADDLVRKLMGDLGPDCHFYSGRKPEINWLEAAIPLMGSHSTEDFAAFIFAETPQYKLFLQVTDFD